MSAASELVKRRRREWVEANGPCAECGGTERLEIDHVDYRTKLFKIADIWCRSRVIRESELAKCQVLCHECHRQKTSAEMSQRRLGVKYVQEHAPPEMWKVTCKQCSQPFEREAKLERYHSKTRKHGPFCSTSCRNVGMSLVRWEQYQTSDEVLTTNEDILRLGRVGVPMSHIKDQLGVSPQRIRQVLTEAGVAFRKRGRREL